MNKKTLTLLVSAAACLMSGCGGATRRDEAGRAVELTPATVSSQPAPPTQISPPATPAPAASTQPSAIGPRIEQARIVTKGDGLGVEVKVAAREGAKLTLSYVWTVNGAVVSTADSLAGLKRGDHVSVDITANDGLYNGPVETLSIMIANSAPMITPNKEMVVDQDGFLTYQVLASDLERDAMTYFLVKAPPGMEIEPQTGRVTWDTQSVPDGEYAATVRVTDSQGASADFTFSVKLSREGAA